MGKIYYSLTEIRDKIQVLHEKGLTQGCLPGFDSLNPYYSFKLGCTTYVVGSPTSGKTEIIFEFMLNLSEKYGWKHAIFSPETGSKEEIAAELISKYLRKPFFRHTTMESVTEEERFKAEAYLSQFFYIIDPADKDLTIEDFYKVVDEIETHHGKIHMTLGDPFNEFKHNFKDDDGRQDLYIERILGLCRKNARNHNRHNIIITHCRDQQGVRDTETGITWYPAPTARDYAGGQAWFRKGLGMLCIYRPPYGLKDPEGVPYEANEVHILIQKAKPKGIGKTGKVKLYFDVNRNRYYEDTPGQFTYAWHTDRNGNPLNERPLTNISSLLTKEDAPF